MARVGVVAAAADVAGAVTVAVERHESQWAGQADGESRGDGVGCEVKGTS